MSRINFLAMKLFLKILEVEKKSHEFEDPLKLFKFKCDFKIIFASKFAAKNTLCSLFYNISDMKICIPKYDAAHRCSDPILMQNLLDFGAPSLLPPSPMHSVQLCNQNFQSIMFVFQIFYLESISKFEFIKPCKLG